MILFLLKRDTVFVNVENETVVGARHAPTDTVWGFENDYGKGIFDKSDFQTLAEILKHLQGKFILSLNDVPEVRNIFEGFNFKEVQVAYTCGKKHTTGREVLIKNF